MTLSFRPLSGIMFSIDSHCSSSSSEHIRFRPLSGIMFSIPDNFRSMHAHISFRPLSGIMFSIEKLILKRSRTWRFRPLSGIMFSISFTMRRIYGLKIVSVPSRGLCFQSAMWAYNNSKFLQFPSPLGDYVFNQEPPP